MKTLQYVKELQRAKGLRTPYAVAKYLGLSPSTVLNWFNKGTTFSEEIAEQIARELDIDPAAIQADIRAELAKDEASRSTWRRIADTFRQHGTAAVLALVVVGGALLSFPVDVAAADNSLVKYGCILCKTATVWWLFVKPFFLRDFPKRRLHFTS